MGKSNSLLQKIKYFGSVKIKSMIGIGLLALSAGCGQPTKNNSQQTMQAKPENRGWVPPSAGKPIAGYKERIREDQLNDLYFSVSVVTTDSSRKGLYKVDIAYGYATHETHITLPKWTGDIYLKPVLKKGDEPYEVFLGFEAGDSTFHPYYEIKAVENAIKMEKVMAYRMETTW